MPSIDRSRDLSRQHCGVWWVKLCGGMRISDNALNALVKFRNSWCFHRTFLLLCCLLTANACGEREGNSPGPQTIDIDGLPRLEATEELRIGSIDDPDVGFTQIGSVAIGSDGTVYAVESREKRIRVYSPDGRLLRSMGGAGSGPGEFRYAPTIGVIGDTIWALEMAARRITLFRRNGEIVSAHQFEPARIALQQARPIEGLPYNQTNTALSGLLMPYNMREDRLFVSQVIESAGPARDHLDIEATDTITVPRVRLDLQGAVVDTVGWEQRLPPPAVRVDIVNVGSWQYMVPLPPHDGPLTVPLSDGRVWIERPVATSSDHGTFRVTRIGLAGDTIYSRMFRYRPRRQDDASLDALAGNVATNPGIAGVANMIIPFGRRGRPSESDMARARRAIRAAMKFPPHQVPVQYAWAGIDGSLWLRREDGQPYRWLLIDPGGAPLGELQWPARLNIRWSSGDTLWTMERDELGLQWLVRYRIRTSE